MMYGQASVNGAGSGNIMGGTISPIVTNLADMGTVMQSEGNMQEQDKAESATEPPDNDLIDFDAF